MGVTVDQSMLSFSLTLLFLLLLHNPANSFSPPSPSCTFSSYSSSFLLLLPALPFISSDVPRCPPCDRFNCETQDPKMCKWFVGFLEGGSNLEEMMDCAKGCSNGLPLDDCKFKIVKVFVETQERNVEGKPDERKVKSNGKRSIFFGSQIGNVQEWSRSVCRARGSLLSLWL